MITGRAVYVGTTVGSDDTTTTTTCNYDGTTSTTCNNVSAWEYCLYWGHSAGEALAATDDLLDSLNLRPIHKDPHYFTKRKLFERWTNYIHKLMIARMFNVNHAILFRRGGLSKSGWLARVGKAKKGKW